MQNTYLKGVSVPEKLNFYNQKPTTIQTRWSDLNDEIMSALVVTPSWAVPSDNVKSNETAKRWSTVYDSIYQEQDNYYQQEKVEGDEQLEEENIPRDGYIIAAMEKRDEGGRAYKVIDYKNRYFDLREDTLFDIMLHGSIVDGKIQDKLIWCTINGGTKLFRYGSRMYEQIKFEYELNKEQKPMKVKDLVVGHLYGTKSGVKKVYVGQHSFQNQEQKSREVEVDTGGYFSYRRRTTEYYDTVVDYPLQHTFVDISHDSLENKSYHYLESDKITHLKSPSSFIFNFGKLEGFELSVKGIEEYCINLFRERFSEKEKVYDGFGTNGSIYNNSWFNSYYGKKDFSNQDYVEGFVKAFGVMVSSYYKMFTLDGNRHPFLDMKDNKEKIIKWGKENNILNLERLK